MKKIIFLATIIFTISCTSTKTAIFDHYSYQKTTEIKVEANFLFGKANENFENHKVATEKLNMNLEKMLEYEKNKPNNEITYAMWKVLNDKEKNLLAGFLKKWEEKGKLSPIFIEEAQKQINEALDLIIQYETKKDKETKNLLLELLK